MKVHFTWALKRVVHSQNRLSGENDSQEDGKMGLHVCRTKEDRMNGGNDLLAR